MSLASPQAATRDPASRPGNTRAKLVAALSTVPGLTALPTVPDQATAGAAWPRWIQTTYDGPLCTLAVDTYEVLVTLPAAYASLTVTQGDSFRDLVALTLAAQSGVQVQLVEPAQIVFQAQQAMPGLRLRITTH